MKIYDTIHNAYLGILNDVWNNYDYRCNPRGQNIREILDYQFRIRYPEAVSIVTKDIERNKIIDSYTKKEMDLYNSGSNLVEDFAKASAFWKKIVNPDNKTINSAYGYLLFKNKSCGNPAFESGDPVLDKAVDYTDLFRTPWEWCLESLKADKDTRQALMKFNLPEHLWAGNKDVVCTINGMWMIRENRLNLSINMRSNDVMLGTAFDLPFFISLMDKMLLDLKDAYPNLEKGTYTHMAHSMHAYERNSDAIEKMLGVE